MKGAARRTAWSRRPGLRLHTEVTDPERWLRAVRSWCGDECLGGRRASGRSEWGRGSSVRARVWRARVGRDRRWRGAIEDDRAPVRCSEECHACRGQDTLHRLRAAALHRAPVHHSPTAPDHEPTTARLYPRDTRCFVEGESCTARCATPYSGSSSVSVATSPCTASATHSSFI